MSSFLARLRAIAHKELIQVRRDMLSLAILLGMPAALLLLFGFALTLDVEHVPLAVVDQDRTPASRRLIDDFARTDVFDLVARPATAKESIRLLDEGRIRAALVIPRGYSRDLAAGEQVRVQLLLDGADSNSARVTMGHAERIAAEAGVDSLARRASDEGRPPLRPAFAVQSRVFFNPTLSSAHFVVPGLLGTVVLIATALMTAVSVAREREAGTLETLLVSPVGRLELILGKTLPFLGLAAIDVVLALATAHWVFGVPIRGSVVALAAVTLIYIVGALGLGVLISTVARTQQAAFQITLMTTLLPSFLLSGFVFPVENMVAPVQAIAALVPTQYYIRALRAIVLRGAPLASVLPDVLALGAFALVAPLLAVIRFKKRI